MALERQAEELPQKTLPVHVRKTLRLIEDDLDELGIQPPSDNLQGADLWPVVRQLGIDHLGAWSIGRWPTEDGADAETRHLRPAAR